MLKSYPSKDKSTDNTLTTTRNRSTNRKSDQSDVTSNTQKIKKFLLQKEKSSQKKALKTNLTKKIPNVTDWFSNPETGTSRDDKTNSVSSVPPAPKPRREEDRASKRKRIHSNNGTTNYATIAASNLDQTSNTDMYRDHVNTTNDLPQVGAIDSTQPTTSILKTNTDRELNDTIDSSAPTQANTQPDKLNDNHVVFQDQREKFLPMNPNAVPFYKRARGCFGAESKAEERATALKTLANDGKPPRWAYQLAPYPNYVGPIARSVAHIKHRHALELAREVARALRASGQDVAEQGSLNWATVQQSYGQDRTNAERAQSRLTSMADRERERERERLSQRRELHLATPISDDDICRNFNGKSVPIPNNRREPHASQSASSDGAGPSNAPVDNTQGAQGGADNNRYQPRRPDRNRNQSRGGRNNRGRNRSRSRSPRNGGRPQNRGRNDNRSYSNRRSNSRGRPNNNDRRNKARTVTATVMGMTRTASGTPKTGTPIAWLTEGIVLTPEMDLRK